MSFSSDLGKPVGPLEKWNNEISFAITSAAVCFVSCCIIQVILNNVLLYPSPRLLCYACPELE